MYTDLGQNERQDVTVAETAAQVANAALNIIQQLSGETAEARDYVFEQTKMLFGRRKLFASVFYFKFRDHPFTTSTPRWEEVQLTMDACRKGEGGGTRRCGRPQQI
jgi:hypothetical protein